MSAGMGTDGLLRDDCDPSNGLTVEQLLNRISSLENENRVLRRSLSRNRGSALDKKLPATRDNNEDDNGTNRENQEEPFDANNGADQYESESEEEVDNQKDDETGDDAEEEEEEKEEEQLFIVEQSGKSLTRQPSKRPKRSPSKCRKPKPKKRYQQPYLDPRRDACFRCPYCSRENAKCLAISLSEYGGLANQMEFLVYYDSENNERPLDFDSVTGKDGTYPQLFHRADEPIPTRGSGCKRLWTMRDHQKNDRKRIHDIPVAYERRKRP